MRSFLMIGQSNMAGRGKLGDLPPIQNEQVFVFRSGTWVQAVEPVNPDRTFSGEGPQLAFADAVQRVTGEEIGLIPCAEGGTLMYQWQKGGWLFERAVECALEASKSSALSGILWVQGENDGYSLENATCYAACFLRFLDDLLATLSCDASIPVLVAELSPHLDLWNAQVAPEKQVPFYRTVSAQLASLPNQRPNITCVRSEGLHLMADGIHYDTPSARELGRRFAVCYLKQAQYGKGV